MIKAFYGYTEVVVLPTIIQKCLLNMRIYVFELTIIFISIVNVTKICLL